MIVHDYDKGFDYPMHVVGDSIRPKAPTYKENCYHYYADREITDYFEDYEKRYPDTLNLIRKDAGNQFMVILFYVRRWDSYFVCKLGYGNLWQALDDIIKDVVAHNIVRLNCLSYRHSDYRSAFMNYLSIIAP